MDISALSQFAVEHTALYYLFIFAIGIQVGSFLNVLIFRLPVMIDFEEKSIVNEHLLRAERKPIDENAPSSGKTYKPTLGGRSYCPSCGELIPGWLNIPVFGYIFLRGKAKCCGVKFSIRYPAIEILTGLATCLITYQWGVSLEAVFLAFAAWISIALLFIDWDHFLLPDVLVYPLLWTGLLFSTQSGFVDPKTSIIAAIAGYMILFLLNGTFRMLKGVDGMGNGDFKLLAACGAWLGFLNLPWVVLGAAASTIFIACLNVFNKDPELGDGSQSGVPMGPGLLIGFWSVILYL